MTSEDKLKSYKEGFKDGFAEGYKQGKADNHPLNPYKDAIEDYVLPQRPPKIYDNYACPVCGKSGIRYEVCYNARCPSRITWVETRNNTTEWK